MLSALISFINLVFSEIPFEGDLCDLNTKIKEKKLKSPQCIATRENALGKFKARSRDERF